MIFVTVGTHEQPFDRLVKEVDRLKGEKLVENDIFIQTGYSAYQPQFCRYKDFIPFQEMMERMREADLVITHGGTGSIMLVLYQQKIPMVMPRKKKHNEHIDDHQVLFCKTMEAKKKIIAVYESEDLGPAIVNYLNRKEQPGHQSNVPSQASGGCLVQNIHDKAGDFARKLNEICLELVK